MRTIGCFAGIRTRDCYCAEPSKTIIYAKTDNRQFGALRSSLDIEEIKVSGVPKKTKVNTSWTMSMWHEWVIHRPGTLTVCTPRNELV